MICTVVNEINKKNINYLAGKQKHLLQIAKRHVFILNFFSQRSRFCIESTHLSYKGFSDNWSSVLLSLKK